MRAESCGSRRAKRCIERAARGFPAHDPFTKAVRPCKPRRLASITLIFVSLVSVFLSSAQEQGTDVVYEGAAGVSLGGLDNLFGGGLGVSNAY